MRQMKMWKLSFRAITIYYPVEAASTWYHLTLPIILLLTKSINFFIIFIDVPLGL